MLSLTYLCKMIIPKFDKRKDWCTAVHHFCFWHQVNLHHSCLVMFNVNTFSCDGREPVLFSSVDAPEETDFFHWLVHPGCRTWSWLVTSSSSLFFFAFSEKQSLAWSLWFKDSYSARSFSHSEPSSKFSQSGGKAFWLSGCRCSDWN